MARRGDWFQRTYIGKGFAGVGDDGVVGRGGDGADAVFEAEGSREEVVPGGVLWGMISVFLESLHMSGQGELEILDITGRCAKDTQADIS